MSSNTPPENKMLAQSSNVPFLQNEMSPFVVLKCKFQHERYGAGGALATHEPTRANEARSNPTSAGVSKQFVANLGTEFEAHEDEA